VVYAPHVGVSCTGEFDKHVCKDAGKKELSSPFLHVVGANAEIRALDRQEELKNGYLDQ